jgi:protein-serine/threonine kinase
VASRGFLLGARLGELSQASCLGPGCFQLPRTGPSRDPSRTMANRPSRPLPTPPVPVYPLSGADHSDIYSSFANHYHSSNPHPPFGLPSPTPRTDDGPPPGTLRGGTLLHKGFYDLLALIPTPSPSRFLWGASADPGPEAVAGPRYEDLPGHNNSLLGNVAPPIANLPSSGPVSPKKGRRISKDMVSKPMGFVYVCRSLRLSTS